MTDVSGQRAEPGRRTEVLRVLKDADGPIGIAEIAGELGVHPNTVRFHLDTLVERGQAEQVRPEHRGPGRPPLLFRAVRRMDPSGPRHYRMLAEILTHGVAAGPDARTRAIEAGRAWGRVAASGDVQDSGVVDNDGAGAAGDREAGVAVPGARAAGEDGGKPPGGRAIGGDGGERGEAVGRLVGLLDSLGFAPERRESGGRVRVGLRHCPFLELAEAGDEGRVVCSVHLGLMRGALEAWGAPDTVDRLEAFAEPDLCLAHLSGTGA